jgi:hypothetical protein
VLFYSHGAAGGASYWLGQSISGWGVYSLGSPAPEDGSPPGGNICPAGVIPSFCLSSSSARLCPYSGDGEELHCGRLWPRRGGRLGVYIAHLPSSYLSCFALPPRPFSLLLLVLLPSSRLPSPSTHRRRPRFRHGPALLWVRLRSVPPRTSAGLTRSVLFPFVLPAPSTSIRVFPEKKTPGLICCLLLPCRSSP